MLALPALCRDFCIDAGPCGRHLGFAIGFLLYVGPVLGLVLCIARAIIVIIAPLARPSLAGRSSEQGLAGTTSCPTRPGPRFAVLPEHGAVLEPVQCGAGPKHGALCFLKVELQGNWTTVR